MPTAAGPASGSAALDSDPPAPGAPAGPTREFGTATLPRLLLLAGLALVYFGTARVGFSVAFLAEQVSPVWPPTGIALAAVLLFGYRVWPAIAVGALLANVSADEPLGTALGIAAGNTLEAVVGAWLLQREGFRRRLDRLRDVTLLVLLGAAGGTLVSATIGVTSLCLGGIEPWSRFEVLWLVWWLGDAMGALVLCPALLVWLRRPQVPFAPGRRSEAAALLVALAAVCWFVFHGRVALLFPHPALEYAVFPFVIWAALRFGQRGATLVTLLASILAITGTVTGSGPFAYGSRHESLVLLQLFLGVVAVTGLFLSAAIAERDRAEAERADAAERAARRLRGDLAAREELAYELALADRRKDEFLAMLGHELRNPLAAITSALELLRHGAGPRERVQGVLDRQTAQLRRLVEDLLDLARITRGDIPLRTDAVDLRAIVESAVRGASPQVEAKRHELSVEVPGEAVPIEGDAARLEQVVANLLGNAVKYTPPGGRIEVRLAREGEEAVLVVRDSGIGISAELLPYVFEPFTQAERSLDRAQGGLGIGLTLVQRIVRMHGGSVSARSDGPGQGAELVVRLPVSASAGGEQPGSAAERPAAPLQLLLVDDHPDAAESLAELLRLQGHDVAVANEGAAALEEARLRRPDVVLLDLGLPGMDGYEVARRLRAEEAGERTLLVALTGYGGEEDRRRSRESGIDHHLVKPVDLSALQRLLAERSAEPRG